MLVLGIAVGLAAVGLYKLISTEMVGSSGPSAPALPAETAVLCKTAADVNPAAPPAFKPETAALQGLGKAPRVEGSTPGVGASPMMTDRECTERWIYGYVPPSVPLAEALIMAWNGGLVFPDCALRFVQRQLSP